HRAGVVGKVNREFRVLEIANPVGKPEVQQIEYRSDLQTAYLVHCLVCKAPVVVARSAMDGVVGETIAENLQAQLSYKLEVPLPVGVMPTLFQQITPRSAVVDGRVGALDSGREHEVARISRRQATAIGT